MYDYVCLQLTSGGTQIIHMRSYRDVCSEPITEILHCVCFESIDDDSKYYKVTILFVHGI